MQSKGLPLAPNTPPSRDAEFLTGGGTIGALMRRHDWSASPLGAPETWPQSLRSVVGLLLGSKFPMFVAWGAELGFLYNSGVHFCHTSRNQAPIFSWRPLPRHLG